MESEAEILDRSVIDQLLSRRRAGTSAFHRLLPLFDEEYPALVEALHRAVGEGNLGEVRSVAHKLKGSASVLGGGRLRNAAGEIVDAAIRGENPDEACLDRLVREAEAFRQAAHRLCCDN